MSYLLQTLFHNLELVTVLYFFQEIVPAQVEQPI